jgi:predicted O-methyltransferase YrrM
MAVLAGYHGEAPDTARTPARRNPRSNGTGVAAPEFTPALQQASRAADLETGRLIHILARSRRAPRILELGTSYGYATLWLADAARATGGHLTTMELHDDRAAYARERIAKAGLAAHVDFRIGNAVTLIADTPLNPDFVLIGTWKDLYVPCLDAVYPKLNAGAIIVARHMARPDGESTRHYVRALRAKPHMTSVSVAVGTGLEISRYK